MVPKVRVYVILVSFETPVEYLQKWVQKVMFEEKTRALKTQAIPRLLVGNLGLHTRRHIAKLPSITPKKSDTGEKPNFTTRYPCNTRGLPVGLPKEFKDGND